jgi:hypothetical protein
MAREAIMVGVVVERRVLKSMWADHAWMPVAVLPGVPAAAPWTVLEKTPDVTRYYAGEAELEFYTSDTATYRDNLATGEPLLWVALTESGSDPGVALKTVTADPAEGEALTEPGADIIETVPMPPEIRARLEAFVAKHHVEREFFKRKRGPTVPERGGHA